MNWDLHSALLLYGDFIKLDHRLDANTLLKEIKLYGNMWQKYAPHKPEIPRDCLNLTSIDGSEDGITGSLNELYDHKGIDLTDLDFNTPTNIFKNSQVLPDFFKPFTSVLGRTQILRLPPGGYFPPHHDGGRKASPLTYRLVVALENFNPPEFCWMYGDNSNYKPLYWERGNLYFLNTNKKHWLFNTSDQNSYWLTTNIKVCEESLNTIRRLM